MATRLALIAIVARDGAIGRAGALPWRLKADLAHFRRTTLGAPVIMGRKTWDSLPARFRPLPGRRNVVVTRNAAWRDDGAEPATSLEAALGLLAEAPLAWVIGGAELYALALPRADELVLTEVDTDVPDADAHFPRWPRAAFDEVARESHAAGEDGAPWAYHFVRYRRR
jgi:dihydrofolate reductase